MNSIFKNKILLGITQHEASRPKRRPLSLDPSEAIDCLFKLVRTGMQWRELQPTTASYITVFKHTRRWIQSGIVHDAYASLLQEHVRNHPSKHYIVDSTCIKNAFGRVGLGRNPVDRGRKALNISDPTVEIISKGATQHSEVDRSHAGHANKGNDGTRLRVGRRCDFQAQTKGRRTVHQHGAASPVVETFCGRRHTGTFHVADLLRLPLPMWPVYGAGRATAQRIEVETGARDSRVQPHIRRKTLRTQALSRDQRASPLPKRRMWSHLAP